MSAQFPLILGELACTERVRLSAQLRAHRTRPWPERGSERARSQATCASFSSASRALSQHAAGSKHAACMAWQNKFG